MSTTKVLAVPGSFFDAGIVDPIPGEAPAKSKRPLADDYMGTLSTLFTGHLDEGSAAARECAQLIMRRTQLNKDCADFFQKLEAPLRQKLIDEHENVKRQWREQQAKIETLREQIAELGRDLNVKRDGQARALSALRNAKQKRERLSRFSTRAEILLADQAIEDANARVDKANAAESIVAQTLNHKRLTEFQPLIAELDKIGAEEMQLAASITGAEYTDQLGIVHPART